MIRAEPPYGPAVAKVEAFRRASHVAGPPLAGRRPRARKPPECPPAKGRASICPRTPSGPAGQPFWSGQIGSTCAPARIQPETKLSS